MEGLYEDDILTIKKDESKVLYYTFHQPKGISDNRMVSIYLQYFIPELPYFSKEALIDLLSMALEQCKGKVSMNEKTFLKRLEEKDRDYILNIVIWNKILSGEGLSLR